MTKKYVMGITAKGHGLRPILRQHRNEHMRAACGRVALSLLSFGSKAKISRSSPNAPQKVFN